MAGYHAEHARQTATLRWVALGILIPNTFFVEAALGRFARCRYSAIQNTVQTNTYDPRRHGATPSLLSCRRDQQPTDLSFASADPPKAPTTFDNERHCAGRFVSASRSEVGQWGCRLSEARNLSAIGRHRSA